MKTNHSLFFLLILFVCSCKVENNKQVQNNKKPNILFIMSDDHTAQAIGAYNSRLSSLNPTPTIDRLFREGTIFENVFCVNSICTPSRANILTGQQSQSNGVLDLYDALPVERQYLPLEMSKAGYNTAVIGKWHLTESPDNFDYYSVLPGQGKYFDPLFYTNDGGTPMFTKFSSVHSREVNVVKTIGHSTDVITDNALDWFENKRSKDKPFFCMLQYKAPHDMWEYDARYEDYLKDTYIPEPENMYNQPSPDFGSVATRGENDKLIHEIGSSISKRNVVRNMGEMINIDKNLSDKEYTHQAYQEYLKKYLRCIKGIDDNLKRVFEYLEENDLMENTIIFYTGDQGLFLGEHDFWDKRWMYEEAMRMPLLIRFPEGGQADNRNDWLINNTDFAPTILDLAGVKTPTYMHGRSFASALYGEPKPNDWRTSTYYRYWMHMAHKLGNPAHFGLRTDRYKLIFFYGCDYTDVHGGEKIIDKGGNRYYENTPVSWEFYDLKNDPQEMHNEYDNPKYAKIITDLKEQLIELREDLSETDENYPYIQEIIKENWNN